MRPNGSSWMVERKTSRVDSVDQAARSTSASVDTAAATSARCCSMSSVAGGGAATVACGVAGGGGGVVVGAVVAAGGGAGEGVEPGPGAAAEGADRVCEGAGAGAAAGVGRASQIATPASSAASHDSSTRWR